MINKVVTLGTMLLVANASSVETDFTRLRGVLAQYGFIVKLELPPQRGSYGLLEASSKTIWINPVVFELEIARPTLVHEAIHAAQSCSGGTQLGLLGLEEPPPRMTRPYFFRYRGDRRQLEAEAYTIQVDPDGVNKAIALLHQHCSESSLKAKTTG